MTQKRDLLVSTKGTNATHVGCNSDELPVLKRLIASLRSCHAPHITMSMPARAIVLAQSCTPIVCVVRMPIIRTMVYHIQGGRYRDIKTLL